MRGLRSRRVHATEKSQSQSCIQVLSTTNERRWWQPRGTNYTLEGEREAGTGRDWKAFAKSLIQLPE